MKEAKNLINKFVFDFSKLYPEHKMVPNLHLLLHLPENVENFGPLPFSSCFVFEDLNGQLRNLVHGTNYANLQITSNVAAFIGFENIKSKFLKKDSLAEIFCDGITKVNMRKNLSLIQDKVFILGNCKTLDVPFLLSNILCYYRIRAKKLCFFYRLFKNNVIFGSTTYRRKIKTDSSCIKFLDDGVKRFGKIKWFIKVQNENNSINYYAIVHLLDYIDNNTNLEFLTECKWTNKYVLLDVMDNFSICFFVSIEKRMYVVEPTKIISVE